MSDKLKALVIVGATADVGSELGWVELRDNHGNRTRGDDLTCEGYAPIAMSRDQFSQLHSQIAPYAAGAWNLNGTIPIPEGKVSPLQLLCSDLKADHVLSALPVHARQARSAHTRSK